MNDTVFENLQHPLRAGESELVNFWGYQRSGAFTLRQNGLTGIGCKAFVIDSDFSVGTGFGVHGAGIAQVIRHILPDIHVTMKDVSTPKDTLWALKDAIEKRASVVNLSISTRADKTRNTAEETLAFNYYKMLLENATKRGVTVIVASGYTRDDSSDSFGLYPDPIVVGGITEKGKCIDSNDPGRIDIYAPGKAEVILNGRMNCVFESHSGAAPYVSAACAAISSVVGKDVQRVKDILLSTARQVDGVRVLDIDAVTHELLRIKSGG